MSTTVEVPQPAVETADPSIDEIVASALAQAAANGTAVVADEPTQGAPGADGAHTADTAGATPAPATDGASSGEPATDDQPKPDDITAARVRKMREDIEAREAALTERERQGIGAVLAELLRAPKAWFAKHGGGRTLDDLIDASIAEGKGQPVEDKPDDRLDAIERRLLEREQAETAARNQAAIDAKVAEIKTAIKGNAKFPLLNEADKGQDVIDLMVEYHSIHGKPISWDRAAALVEADLKAIAEKTAKKLGWAPPAAKPTPAAPAPRPGTVSLSGDQRQAAPTDEALPEDPDTLMKFLVAQAEAGARKTA